MVVYLGIALVFFPSFFQNLVVVIQVHFFFLFFGYISLSRFGLCEF